MNERELRSAVTRISSAANKRLTNIGKLDFKGPAYETAMAKGRFTAKGKSGNELVQEYWRLRRFMESKASTVKGVKALRNEFQNEAARIGAERGKEYEDMYWDLFNRWNEVGKGKGITHYQVSDIVATVMKATDDEDVAGVLIQNEIDVAYAERERAKESYDGASPNQFR